MTAKRNDPFGTSADSEAHGMDVQVLDSIRDRAARLKLRDVMVVRNGAVVWEWYEKGHDRVGHAFSCTKSVLSALLGIALEEGRIRSVEQPLADFFPEITDERMRAIRLSHLLTMTSGIDWPDFDKPYREMKKAPDWVRFLLQRSMAHDPGEAFGYNSGGSHLLSAILTRATGLSALAYAREKLFRKMALGPSRWSRSNGVNEGGAGLYLSTGDMAKLGWLYVNRGNWFGKQLVPADWVEESLTAHNKGYVNYDPPIYGCYGYHWWVSAKEHNGIRDYFFAKGFGGQYIFGVPSLELVAVIRKRLEGRNGALVSKKLFHEVILQAVR